MCVCVCVFKVCVSLLLFGLVDLSIGVSGVLKSPTIIVLYLKVLNHLPKITLLVSGIDRIKIKRAPLDFI